MAVVDERSDVVTREVLRAELAGVDVKIAELRAEVHEGFRRQQTWLVATAISIVGVGLGGLGVATTVVIALLSS